MSHLLSRRYRLNGNPCRSRTDCLSEPGKVRMEDMSLCSWIPGIRTKEILREMHNGGSGAHSGINKTLFKVKEKC